MPSRLWSDTGPGQVFGDGIVPIGWVLAAPAIEMEVQKKGSVPFFDPDGAVVTGPAVVGWGDSEVYAGRMCLAGGQVFLDVLAVPAVDADDQDILVRTDKPDDVGEDPLHPGDAILPVLPVMWPGQHDGGLGFPFGRQAGRCAHVQGRG